MKQRQVVLALLLAIAVAGAARSNEPNESDYPVKYEILNTSAIGSLMIGNFCTMALRDPANPTVGLIVQKHSAIGCHVWDAGTVFHGRREKNRISLLVRDKKGKLKVEKWPITGTVVLPAAKP